MSATEDLQSALMATFAVEAFEQLDELQQDLLELERTPEQPELISAAFRHAHTIKGGAASVGLGELRRVGHSLETLLGMVRDGGLTWSPELADAANGAVDTMRALANDGTLGAGEDPGAVDLIVARLEALAVPPRLVPQPAPTVPTVREAMPPELIALFADEAAEQLDAMEQQLLSLERGDTPDREALLQELFRQAHNLKGSAASVEMTDLSALAHAVESVFTSLRANELDPTPGLFDIVHETIDGMRTLVSAAVQGIVATVPTSAYITTLDAVVRNATPSAGGQPTPAAPVAEAPEAVAVAPAPAAAPVAVTEAAGPAPASPSPARASTPATQDVSVRVPVSKLDGLLVGVGELLAVRIGAEQRLVELRGAQGRLGELERSCPSATADQVAALRRVLDEITGRMGQDVRRLRKAADELHDGIRGTRMLPMHTILGAMPRLVRDLSRDLGKEVDLQIEGAETEVDKTVIEQLKAPLTHVIRNALDHGLEDPATRSAAGKPTMGTLTLRAAQQGAQLVMEIIDDGAGIDADRVREKAVEKGVLSADEALLIDDEEARALIFQPGFSTRSEVTDVSGRGVGMDVVRVAVEQLDGRIELESSVGTGTTLRLIVPLSVASTRGLFVRAGGQTLTIPVAAVERIIRIKPGDLKLARGRSVIVLDDAPLTVVELADVLRRPVTAHASNEVRVAFILGTGEKRVVFAADELVGGMEMVVKQLPAPLVRVPGVAGATTLASGEVVLVLAAAELLRQAGRTQSSLAIAPPVATAPVAAQREPADARVTDDHTPDSQPATEPEPVAAPSTEHTAAGPPSLLVVEDSATIRMLEKQMLEAAGYRVTTATDGAEGWEMLSAGASFDAVVSDVEMPRMTGIELTRCIRGDTRLRDLPLVLVTSLDSDEHRQAGLQAGADAYVVKGSAEQDLLVETLTRLI